MWPISASLWNSAAEHPWLAVAGLVGAFLTFVVFTWRDTVEYAIPAAIIVFAIAQMGVHLVFFLHITTGPDNTNNVLALAFGVLFVVLLIGGSVWIMSNMNSNMMQAMPQPHAAQQTPMSQPMRP
ncbi:cytochrome o ubiquinol oxidase subunit IV [Methylobacterium sp. P31]